MNASPRARVLAQLKRKARSTWLISDLAGVSFPVTERILISLEAAGQCRRLELAGVTKWART